MKMLRFLLVVGIFVLSIGLLRNFVNDRPATFLTFDFLAYHASTELFLSGANPYDPVAVEGLQREVAPASIQHWLPARSWYSPWTYPLFALIFNFEHQTAATLWFVINIALLLLVAVLSWQVFADDRQVAPRLLFLGMLFFPVKEVFAWGQAGLLLTFGVVGFLWCLKTKRDFLAGCSIVLLSIKPQLSFLVFPVLLWWIFRERRYRVLCGMAGTFVLCSVLALCWVPTIFSDWFVALADSPSRLHTPTLAGWLRYYLSSADAAPPVWPLYVLPVVGMLLAAFYVWNTRARFSWQRAMPLLLSLTLIAAPYVNVHDFVLLILLHIGAIAATKERLVIATYVALQVIAVVCSVFLTDATGPFVWFPYVMLLLWCWSSRRSTSQIPV